MERSGDLPVQKEKGARQAEQCLAESLLFHCCSAQTAQHTM